MMSPEWYYEAILKDKTEEQLKKEIRSLKRKISRLKKVVANPQDYMEEWGICPDPEVQLHMHILYLEKATEALMNAVECLCVDDLKNKTEHHA